jgi:hypothetical protein
LFFSCRRGFATASDVSARVGLSSITQAHGKLEDKPVFRDGPEACSPWAPDPETGYYRPINYTPKIDPVELRRICYSNPIPDHHPNPTRVRVTVMAAVSILSLFLHFQIRFIEVAQITFKS